jgi:hypothetical protein
MRLKKPTRVIQNIPIIMKNLATSVGPSGFDRLIWLILELVYASSMALPAPLVRNANLAPAYTDRPSKWKVKKVLTAGFVSGDEWPAPGGNLASSIGPMMASLLQGCRACTCDFLITSFFGFGALPTPRVGSRNGRRLSAGFMRQRGRHQKGV